MKQFELSMYRHINDYKKSGYELVPITDLFEWLPKNKSFIFYEKNEKCAIKVMNKLFNKKFKDILTYSHEYSVKRKKNRIMLSTSKKKDCLIFEVK